MRSYYLIGFFAFLLCHTLVAADFSYRVTGSSESGYRVCFSNSDGVTKLLSPEEGLWSVSFGFSDGAPTDWRHIQAVRKEVLDSGALVLSGSLPLEKGEITFRDTYSEEKGLLRGVRRIEYHGDKALENLTLSVRFCFFGDSPQVFLPGILYYGNPSGEKNTPNNVPAYHALPGEFALFEEHRYPIPVACFEDSQEKVGAALYSLPSPVQRGAVADQWWSLGTCSLTEQTHELDLYSGFVGYNHTLSVVKALQLEPLPYPPATMTLAPGMVVEKTFWLDLWSIPEEGTAFQKTVQKGVELFEPFSTDGLPRVDDILRSKFRFALSRWIEGDGYAGFNMYPPEDRKRIVMGWCGQADSCGYSFIRLAPELSAYSGIPQEEIYDKVQRSLDHLTTSPVDEDGFSVAFDVPNCRWDLGRKDPVSMGQGMYNFAKAIEAGRDVPSLDTSKWESFLKKASVAVSRRILSENWSPRSTAEAFFIAPLALSARIFSDDPDQSALFLQAAKKGAAYYYERHHSMREPYWGGTLDASSEDKEGAWAAFQAFLTMYETTGEEIYLGWSQHAAEVMLSYLVVWDIPFSQGRLADHSFKTRGWTVVSPQNQHLDVFGVLFAPEVRRLGELTGNEAYQKVSEVMFRSCGQLIDEYGSQGEQIQQTNYTQDHQLLKSEEDVDVLSFRGGYVESWTVFWITAHFLNAAARMKEYHGFF